MKLFLQAALCFVFVAAVFGQGYGRRQRRPKVLRTAGFDPISDLFGTGVGRLRGGRRRVMPDHIKKILGSTVTGEAIVGGMGDFPRHGGTLNEDGLVNGWGADPNQPIISAVDMWSDPLNGAAFPTDYNGQELVFDTRLNRYVVKKDGSVGHQIAKESHVAAKTGGIISGGVPSSHNTVKAEHNIVKEANHIARKTIGGVGVVGSPIGVDPISHNIDKKMTFGTGSAGTLMDPVGHNIGKSTLGADAVVGHNLAKTSGRAVGIGFLNPGGPVATRMAHDIAKSTGVVRADPFGIGIDPFGQVSHGAVKASSGRHIGVSKLGPVNVGHVGFDAPEVIAHKVGKATLGTDAVVGHNIAKSSGSPVGIGFLNPGGPIASQMEHDIAKATSNVAIDPFDTVGHDIAKATGGVGRPHVGIVGKTTNPVHNVNKVGQAGLAGMGHDPLAASLGHGIAKQAMGEAAAAVEMGSRGGVSAGDPIAVAATHGLVRESLHVAGKTLDMASSGVTGGRRVGVGLDNYGKGSGMIRGSRVGMDIFGQGPFVHPKPVKKPPPKFPTGYGRRRV
ncbi:uncharacterized protein LOC123566484 [Mercenaria mercenaria]|uniref:uncharacterized protein LOC123566484 n=1 Tax=Mercenaria mercenaria TaxID=6596 RepID=UPI00234E6C9C|nr:uncharacterized protein LOC123566484 [Mercenaria mercenaria]